MRILSIFIASHGSVLNPSSGREPILATSEIIAVQTFSLTTPSRATCEQVTYSDSAHFDGSVLYFYSKVVL